MLDKLFEFQVKDGRNKFYFKFTFKGFRDLFFLCNKNPMEIITNSNLLISNFGKIVSAFTEEPKEIVMKYLNSLSEDEIQELLQKIVSNISKELTVEKILENTNTSKGKRNLEIKKEKEETFDNWYNRYYYLGRKFGMSYDEFLESTPRIIESLNNYDIEREEVIRLRVESILINAKYGANAENEYDGGNEESLRRLSML